MTDYSPYRGRDLRAAMKALESRQGKPWHVSRSQVARALEVTPNLLYMWGVKNVRIKDLYVQRMKRRLPELHEEIARASAQRPQTTPL